MADDDNRYLNYSSNEVGQDYADIARKRKLKTGTGAYDEDPGEAVEALKDRAKLMAYKTASKAGGYRKSGSK